MPTPITIDANVNLDFRSATAKASAFQKQFAAGFTRAGGLKGITTDVNNFDAALGKATSRIVSLGAASVVFNTLRKSFGAFADATIEVEQALAKINVNLGQSADGLKQFSGQIFNVARQTGSTFEDAAKGAEELARQGLGAEETLKRLSAALILNRTTGLGVEESINSVTSALNTFNKEALTASDVVNRLAAVDTKFAVSSKDLAEAVQRVGSSAAEAGVDFNQLLAIVTSVQQTTQRGGATIGNALKTIFTRVGNPEVLNDLQAIGVAVKDVEGNTLPAIRILQNLATVYDTLGTSQKNVVSRQVAGTYQINILKAALSDLNKEQSVYNGALKTAANAGDAAIKKNEELNKTLQSLITNTGTSIKQLFASIGNQNIAPFTKELLGAFEKVRAVLSGDGDDIGSQIGQGILKGITNVITGPGILGLTVVLAKGFGKVISTIGAEAKGLLGLNDAASKRAEIQGRINALQKAATSEEIATLQAARGVLAQKEAILAISARIRQTELIGTPLQNAFLGSGPLGGAKITGPRKVGSFARGHIGNFADPLFEAIKREKAAGVPEHLIYVDKDKRVASSDNPHGLLVANKRDEPAGGFQGVDRAISEGRDPKKVGTRPNFANLRSQRDIVNQRFGLNDPRYDVGAKGALASTKGTTSSDILDKKREAAIQREIEQTNKLTSKLALVDKGFSDFSARLIRTNGGLTDPGSGAAARQQAAYFSTPRDSAATGAFFGGGQRNATATGRPIRLPDPNARDGRFTRDAFRRARVEDYRDSGQRQKDIVAQNERLSNLRPQLQAAAADKQQKNANAIENAAAEKKANRSRFANNASLAAAFVLPAASGFIADGAGGTAEGKGRGALKGALTGAGTGAILGPVGAGIGAVAGGLIGYLSKLSKSVEEFNAEIDKGTAAQTQNVEAIARFSALGSQISEADNASPDARGRLAGQRADALSKVDPEFRAALSKQDITTEETNKILAQAQDKLARIANTADATKKLNAINKADSGFGANIASKIPAGSLLDELINPRADRVFSDVKNADSLTPNLLEALKDKGGLGKGDKTFVNRSLANGEAGAGDVEKVNKILESLGQTAAATKDNFLDVIQALSKSSTAFIGFSKILVDLKAKQDARPALVNNKSFLNVDLAGEATSSAFGGTRRPGVFQNRAARNQRDTSFLGNLNRLDDFGAFGKEGLAGTSNPNILKQQDIATARASKFGLLSDSADFIKGFDQFKNAPLTGDNGDLNEGVIKSILERIAKGSDAQAAALASVRSNGLKIKDENLAKLGIKTAPQSLNGYQVGSNYGTFAGTTRGFNSPRGSNDPRIVTDERVGSRGEISGNDVVDKARRAKAYFDAHISRNGPVSTDEINTRVAKDRARRDALRGNRDIASLKDDYDPRTTGPSSPVSNDPNQRRDEDIAAYFKAVKDATDLSTAKIAETIVNASLKITLDIQGLSEGADSAEVTTQLQTLFQALADVRNQAARDRGTPNPPGPAYKGVGPKGPGLYATPASNPGLAGAIASR